MREKASVATAVFLGGILVWIIAMSALSLLANGWLYHIRQPLPVTEVTASSVTVLFDRYSRCSMNGRCATELVCDLVHTYPARDCVIESGRARWEERFDLPGYVDGGSCRLVGLVSYAPLGEFGPRLSHEWKSEAFRIPEGGR